MRILYHHRTLADGAEGIHIAEMVAAFRSLGHDVHVRSLAGPENSPPREGLVTQLKGKLPPAAFEAASMVSNVADYLEVHRAIRTLRPDFLYKRHARFDVGALTAARHAGIPTVLEVNCLFTGADYQQFEPMTFNRLAARCECRALRQASVVVAVSTPLAREIARLVQVEAVVIPNGADPQRFDPAVVDRTRVRARYGLREALTVGWAGVMRDWHGLELLLDVISRIPDVRLLLVGDGPARARVEGHAAALGIRHRLTITGRVPQEQMPEHLAAMDVAVVASDRTRVASPMKLLEYMAMERAVVAPRLENIAELITEGRDGLLFAPENSDSLTGVLQRLAADPRLRSTLGRQARRTVVDVRNWRSNAAGVLALVGERRCARSGVADAAPEHHEPIE
jgi:glycosyltransferase involved in cell wall biosynthesis